MDDKIRFKYVQDRMGQGERFLCNYYLIENNKSACKRELRTIVVSEVLIRIVKGQNIC